MMYRTVTVSPTLLGSQITVIPALNNTLITVGANIITQISYHEIPIEYYEGDYEVTPRAHSETVLETNGLMMTDDVTVHQIPYFETSNVSNGYTVYIADEV